MRAWRATAATGPAGLALSEIPPPNPAPGEVLVEVHAAGLNFSDLLMTSGTYQVKPPLPFTAGQEIAGRIVRAGRASRWHEGQRVAAKVTWGAFAEAAPARESMLIALPEDLPYSAGATLPVVWPTSWIALFARAGLRAGETLLVHAAAGGVGLAAVQLASAAGARVIAGVGDVAKSALALGAGAAHVINTRNPDWTKQVMDATGGRGADVVFDPVGAELADASLKCLSRNGRYLIVGFAGGRIPELRANRLLLRNASALGVYWSHEEDGELVARALADILAQRASGNLRIEASTIYPFSGLREALADLAARRTTGKCVLKVREES
jgi:NADPH2:quinone reductase